MYKSPSCFIMLEQKLKRFTTNSYSVSRSLKTTAQRYQISVVITVTSRRMQCSKDYRFWSKEHIESEPINKWAKDVKTTSANFKDKDDQIREDCFRIQEEQNKERMRRE